jgi:O-acetylserine/cysteine efflux transporter
MTGAPAHRALEAGRTHPLAGLNVADGVMFLVVLIWAGNNVIVKQALDEIDPVAYVLGRFLLVVLLLFPWLRVRGTSLRVRRLDVPLLILSGVTGFALYNLLFTVGLAETTAFSVALLISLGPVFTLMLAAALQIERVRPVQWLGVLLALAGIGAFVWDKLAQDLPATGDLLSLLSAMAWAVYSLTTRRLSGRYPATTVTAWAALVGVAAVLPVAFGPALEQDWIGIGFAGWGAMLYSSAFSMLIGYSLWSWAIARRGVGRTAPYLYLVPILTGLISLLFLDEQFGVIKIAGALLVLAGLVLVRRVDRRASPAPAAR